MTLNYISWWGSISRDLGSVEYPFIAITSFYWNRKTSTDWSESGVTFVVRNGLLLSMSEDPKSVSDRLILLKFPFVNSRYCILIAASTPTMTNSLEKIINFYNQLNQILCAILYVDKIVFIGGFSTQVSQSYYTWLMFLS